MATAKKSSGITNTPFAQNMKTAFPYVKWILALAGTASFAYMSLWLKSELYTRAEGEQVESQMFTRADAEVMHDHIDVNEKRLRKVEDAQLTLNLEQKYTNQKLDTIVDLMEKQHQAFTRSK